MISHYQANHKKLYQCIVTEYMTNIIIILIIIIIIHATNNNNNSGAYNIPVV